MATNYLTNSPSAGKEAGGGVGRGGSGGAFI